MRQTLKKKKKRHWIHSESQAQRSTEKTNNQRATDGHTQLRKRPPPPHVEGAGRRHCKAVRQIRFLIQCSSPIDQKYGLKGRVTRKKPFISPVNRKNRIIFAKQHMRWRFEDWAWVIWSLMRSHNQSGSDGRMNIWQMQN